MTGFTYGPDDGATYGPDDGGVYSPTGTTQPLPQRPADGATYGPDNGGTYGPEYGFLWSPGERHYRINGVPITGHVDERRTFTTTELVFELSADELADVSDLQQTAEQFQRVTNADGGFLTLDRSDTTGVVSLQPPAERQPPRVDHDTYVAGYSQTPLKQTQDAYRLTLSLVDESDREPTTADTPSRSPDEWEFAFRGGDVVTRRVRYDPEQSTQTGSDDVTLTLICDATQTAVIEESASRLDAVAVREVPDGANTFDDNSTDPADANTVTVTTPDGTDPIREGEWVVVDWSTEWLHNAGYRVELTLGRPA